MRPHYLLSPEERVAQGVQWLEERAPCGYVFNMFTFKNPGYKYGPVCMINMKHVSEYNVLLLAFKHDIKFRKEVPFNRSIVPLQQWLGLSNEEMYSLGFDNHGNEGVKVLDAMEAEWQRVMKEKLWEACEDAGKDLALMSTITGLRPRKQSPVLDKFMPRCLREVL